MITFAKKILANKDSYWRKHKEKIHGSTDPVEGKRSVFPVSEKVKERFNAGEVILVDKPLHWTSFDIVRKLRNSVGIKKVGHAGTLDPLATGLLIVCTGKFTKKINDYMAQEKEYTGAITLGAVTPTYDLESTPEQQKGISGIDAEKINKTVQLFTGEIQQIPPIYSAIKKKGTALYELARRGETIELQPRTVFMHAFEITEIDLPVVKFRIVCSTGTYIRSIANDFGAALGCGGYLSELRRTKIGEFNVADAKDPAGFIEELTKEPT